MFGYNKDSEQVIEMEPEVHVCDDPLSVSPPFFIHHVSHVGRYVFWTTTTTNIRDD